MEIVIVDDFSNNKTLSDFLFNIKKLHNVNILIHEKNMGAFYAKLDGFRAANGEFIMSCDDDDIPDIEYYKEMIKNIDSFHKVFIASNSVIGKLNFTNISRLIQVFHNLVNIAFKKDLLENINYPTEKRIIRDDAPLVIPIYLKATFDKIKFYDNLYNYKFNVECKHEHQFVLTHQKKYEKQIKNGYDFLTEYINFFNLSYAQEAINEAYRTYINISY